MSEPLIIFTERQGVVLRELASDADDAVYYESYSASRSEIEIFDPPSAIKHQTLADTRKARLEAGDKIRMGIWDGDTFVGSVNARPDAEGIEVGYWTDSRYVGRGYAALGAKALSGYVADHFKSVHAQVVEGNDASVKVLKKAGYRQIGRSAGCLFFEYSPSTITKAQPQDVQALTDFMQLAYASNYPNDRGIKKEMFENSTFHNHLSEYLVGRLGEPATTLLMAKDKNRVINGTIGVAPTSDEDGAGEVWGFYVAPAQQAQGIGTELWSSLMNSDLVKPFDQLMLTVAKDSKVATEFYKKHGFEVIREEEWNWPSWTSEHLVNQYWVMRKRIGS